MRELNLALGIFSLALLGYSWYIHFKVKDGIARQMFLWGCGMIFLMVLTRVVTYILLNLGLVNGLQVNTIFTWNFYWVYILILGQFIIQNRKE